MSERVVIEGVEYERVKPFYHYDNIGGRMVRGHVVGWELIDCRGTRGKGKR